jgi:dihydropteroate synthase
MSAASLTATQSPQRLAALLKIGRPLVMGVLNVTPDSFSDSGKFAATDAAVAHAHAMCADGADLIDLGGESTRPGAQPVPEAQQIQRVVPVLNALADRADVTVSIDTSRAAVARAALDAGAAIVNDITAGRGDSQMFPLVAARGVPIILMHMQGTPATMQLNPSYQDVMVEVSEFLQDRLRVAAAAGIPLERTLLDPGIGFGKTMAHNLQLLRRQIELKHLGRPMVIGASRKKFIGTMTGETKPGERVMGTAAAVAWSVANGADIVRVHDVAAMARVVRMIRAIATGEPTAAPAPAAQPVPPATEHG